jgi:peptidyl-prolyl cis-trans isomerase C
MAALVVLVGGVTGQTPATSSTPAAEVDGQTITMAEVEAVVKQAGPMAAKPTELQLRQMRMEAVGMLIDELLMQRFLRKNGPKIDPKEVNEKLADLEKNLKKQNKSLEDFYRESGQTEVQLRVNLLNMLQWDGYVKEHLTEADIKRYYDENKDFFDRVAVRASHLVLRVPPNAAENERQEIRTKLQVLRQDILGGKIDFAEAAKKHSQCSSAPNGGDIGYFPRKLAVEEAIAKVAFALKVGEISDVVQSDYGLHLIKVTDRKPGQPSEFSKIKDDVQMFYIEEMRLNLLAQQRKTANIKINLP